VDPDIATVLAGSVVFATFTLGMITGIGGAAVALPVVSLLLGVRLAVPLLVLCSFPLGILILVRDWRHIGWREYGCMLLHIAPLFPVGMLLFSALPEAQLKVALGLFSLGLGVHGLIRERRDMCPASATPTPGHRLGLLAGGLVHGAFGVGGPFIVLYASAALRDKTVFRATITMLWMTLNPVLMSRWAFSPSIWTDQLGSAAVRVAPFLLAAILLGQYLHGCVKPLLFRLLVYGLLAASGVAMAVSAFL
jgi:uncharacterized membrane protein YfcA